MTTPMVGRRSTMTGKPFTADDVAKLFTRFITRHLPADGTVELAGDTGMPLGTWRPDTIGDGEFRKALTDLLPAGGLIGLTVNNTVAVWTVADDSITATDPAPIFDPETELVAEISENMVLGDTVLDWLLDLSPAGHHTLSTQLGDRPPHQMTYIRTAHAAIIDPLAESEAMFIPTDIGSALLRGNTILMLTLHSDIGDGCRHIRVWGVTPTTVTALTGAQTRSLARYAADTDVFEDAWPPAGISDQFTAVVRDD